MFDVNEDEHVDINDSEKTRFNEVSSYSDAQSVDGIKRNAWEEFEDKLDDTSYIGRLRKQVSELYLRIHSSADGDLLQRYESLVRSLLAESRGHALQNLRLESRLRRAEERLDRLWTELQAWRPQVYHREEAAQKEMKTQKEQQRFEAKVMTMQMKHDGEVSHKNEHHLGRPLQRLIWAPSHLDHGESVVDTSNDSCNSEESLQHDIHMTSKPKMSPRKLEEFGLIGPASSASYSRKRLLTFPLKDDTTMDTTYKLVLAGDAGSGKSSFLLRLSRNEFRETQSAVGVECKVKNMLVDGENTTLQIWDTAGQERFRSVTRSYFRNAHGILLLYEVTRESSFLNVGQWMDLIQESTDGPVQICVIGNKVDRRSELPEGSCVSKAQGERLAMTHHTLFCETSAKEGRNITEAVLHLARAVKNNLQLKPKSGSQLVPNIEWTPTSCGI